MLCIGSEGNAATRIDLDVLSKKKESALLEAFRTNPIQVLDSRPHRKLNKGVIRETSSSSQIAKKKK
jgi:hypothetical protein